MILMNKNDEWYALLDQAAKVLQHNNNQQKILAQIAYYVYQLNKTEGLRAFCEDLSQTGVTISYNTLRTYKTVWDKLINYTIPVDINWTNLREISRTHNPQEWIDKINSGYSNAELWRELKLLKPTNVKDYTCPNCGETIKI